MNLLNRSLIKLGKSHSLQQEVLKKNMDHGEIFGDTLEILTEGTVSENMKLFCLQVYLSKIHNEQVGNLE